MTPTQPVLVLAPIRGITDAPFRTLFARHFGGFDYAVAPFVTTVKGDSVAPSHLRDVAPAANVEMTVVPQFLGNDPHDIRVMLDSLAQVGYAQADWNLGCPFEKVTRKARGSGLLAFPDRVVSILDAVLPAAPIRLSLKVRLGLDNPEQLKALLERIGSYPLHTITIHARTAADMYEGPVNLEAFEQCLPLCTVPVHYNGDIGTADDLRRLDARFGGSVRGWMIGRGAIADPFLPRKIRGMPLPSRDLQIAALASFHGDLMADTLTHPGGPSVHLGRLKEFWRLFGRWFESDGRLTGKLCRTQSITAYRVAIDRLFDHARADETR